MSTAPSEPISSVRKPEYRPVSGAKSGLAHDSGRRSALDGIRAVAVSAVLIYHFGGGSTSWLPGGFLGVDVFFVLSGYLITGLLLAEYGRRGRIDLPGFWVRRARRLVPALIPMLLAVCAWVWWATPLESYPDRRSDIFWTVGYLANWHLIRDADDYFAAYSAASPLRHTWSLAIEEQFYLVWPFLLVILLGLGSGLMSRLAARDRRRPVARVGLVARVGPVAPVGLVALVAAIGAGLSAWTMAAGYDPAFPATVYYGTTSRVQELFAGVLLALAIAAVRTGRGSGAGPGSVAGPRLDRVRSALRRRSGLVATIALALLGTATVLMSDTAAFYYRGGALGVSLLVVALLAMFELCPKGAAAQVFSWRPVVALGRISYGVYLWHWPIALAIPVAARHSMAEQILRQGERVGLTLLLAALSFRFIEQPVQRDRRWLTSRHRVLIAVLASSSLVVAVAWPATALPGTLAAQMAVRTDRSCSGGETFEHLISCTLPAGVDAVRTPPAFALLGDSLGRALGPGLDDWARATGHTWVKAAWRRCPSTGLIALSGQSTKPDSAALSCHEQAPTLIRTMLDTYHPPVVLISETWTSDHSILVDGANAAPGTPAHSAAVRTGYERLVDEISAAGGRAVFVELAPVGDSLGVQYAPNRPAGAHRPTALDTSAADRHNALLREVVAARPGRAELVSITDVLCPNGSCPAVIDGTLLRKDGTHYTLGFSSQLAPILLTRAHIVP